MKTSSPRVSVRRRSRRVLSAHTLDSLTRVWTQSILALPALFKDTFQLRRGLGPNAGKKIKKNPVKWRNFLLLPLLQPGLDAHVLHISRAPLFPTHPPLSLSPPSFLSASTSFYSSASSFHHLPLFPVRGAFLSSFRRRMTPLPFIKLAC